MRILGIEGTAHTVGVGIVEINDKVEVLSNERHTLTKHEGGMIPYEVGEHHTHHIKDVTLSSLESAGLSIKDIDLISYSHGPGFGAGLQVVSVFARALGLKNNIPVVGVHHGIAHILIAKYLFDMKNDIYLYVSGGNSQIVVPLSPNYFCVLGETEDIAVGNALDKLAREMGYGFPGGKVIENLAKSGKFIDMPYTVKGMDVSFSGILTYAIKLIGKETNENIAYSFQEHVFAMLIETLERSMAYSGRDEVCVVGGVGLNSRLQEMAEIMVKERGAKFYRLAKEFLGDNGAMIAVAGYHYHKYGYEGNPFNAPVRSRWRIEEGFKL